MWKIMNNGFLSQEEIDSLLNGGGNSSTSGKENLLTDTEKDLIGEIGNISMGSASTALSQIINHQVNITTPVVTLTTLSELKAEFEVPNLALEVQYVSGIVGKNLLIMKIPDAGIISNLMMGGDGNVVVTTLSEIEESAVSEAMNQMIGSAATSMATMFGREVNISPPKIKILNNASSSLSDDIDENETIVKTSFKLTIDNLLDSFIMQILPIETAKKIVAIMTDEEKEPPKQVLNETEVKSDSISNNSGYERGAENIQTEPQVEVHKAAFQPLTNSLSKNAPKNIDLILDVPLEISVVLGRTQKTIKDILNLGTGSLVELNKLAEEPVEVLVNGKRVAYGEVVVVDENFGVRITSIVDNSEKVKSLMK
jgi:flagellar motor switch protein FliN